LESAQPTPPAESKSKLGEFWTSTPVWGALAVPAAFVVSSWSVKAAYALVWAVLCFEFIRLRVGTIKRTRVIANSLFPLALASVFVLGWSYLPKPKDQPDFDKELTKYGNIWTEERNQTSANQPEHTERKSGAEGTSQTASFPRVVRHTLSKKEIEKFQKPLIAEKTDRPQIRLACPAIDETECVYAGQFIGIFRDAGWTVPEGIVERQTLSIPYDGIRIFVHTDAHDDLGKSKGNFQWMAITRGMVAIYDSFSNVGIISDAGHGDAIPKDSLTIYFGPPKQDESVANDFTKTVQGVKYQWAHNPLFLRQQPQ